MHKHKHTHPQTHTLLAHKVFARVICDLFPSIAAIWLVLIFFSCLCLSLFLFLLPSVFFALFLASVPFFFVAIRLLLFPPPAASCRFTAHLFLKCTASVCIWVLEMCARWCLFKCFFWSDATVLLPLLALQKDLNVHTQRHSRAYSTCAAGLLRSATVREEASETL